MKNALIAAASLAAIAVVVPAAAQAQNGATRTGPYIGLNAGIIDGSSGIDLKAIQGRAGYRFNNWIGVEGDLATGIDSDTDSIGGVDVNTKLKYSAAGYVVGFAPIGPNTDVLARVGYGTTKLRAKAVGVSASDSEESFNFGLGAQHHFDGLNGVRFDYTRQEFDGGDGHANTWSLGYTRKF